MKPLRARRPYLVYHQWDDVAYAHLSATESNKRRALRMAKNTNDRTSVYVIDVRSGSVVYYKEGSNG